jgi:hypothetical protein
MGFLYKRKSPRTLLKNHGVFRLGAAENPLPFPPRRVMMADEGLPAPE